MALQARLNPLNPTETLISPLRPHHPNDYPDYTSQTYLFLSLLMYDIRGWYREITAEHAVLSGSVFPAFILPCVISECFPSYFSLFYREFCRKGWTHAVSERWCLGLDILPRLFQICLGEGNYEKK